MSKHTEKSLFMLPPSVKYAGFYQELLRGIDNYRQLGNRLIHSAEQACAFRQNDTVSEFGRILSAFPINQYQPIGHYYLAVSLNKGGKGELDKARSMFELVADTAPTIYRAKAIHALAAVSAHRKDTDSELYFFVEALKVSRNISTSLIASRGIAVHKAREGYHSAALKDLERMLPFIKYAPPHIYFDYLNSLAVELGEVGRKYEARNVIQHVLESPFIIAYPEWRETAEDLKGPNRSFIALPAKPEIIYPVTKPKKEKLINKPASVVAFPHKLKEASPPPKPNAISQTELSEMTEAEKRGLLLSLIHSHSISEKSYDRVLIGLGAVTAGPGVNEIDLEDLALVDNIISEWCNLIEPDQFAAVMSALRDCDNSTRRNNIIDAMITVAFRQTGASIDSEEVWRTQVECKLPKK